MHCMKHNWSLLQVKPPPHQPPQLEKKHYMQQTTKCLFLLKKCYMLSTRCPVHTTMTWSVPLTCWCSLSDYGWILLHWLYVSLALGGPLTLVIAKASHLQHLHRRNIHTGEAALARIGSCKTVVSIAEEMTLKLRAQLTWVSQCKASQSGMPD